MFQIIAETLTNKIQITAVKSIFLYAAQRYVHETLYSVILNSALGLYRFLTKLAENKKKMCEFKMTGMCRKQVSIPVKP